MSRSVKLGRDKLIYTLIRQGAISRPLRYYWCIPCCGVTCLLCRSKIVT